jgi:RNA polymerase sigma-70 factor (ECF subfamily)
MSDQPGPPEPSAPEGLAIAFTEAKPALLRMAVRMCGNAADAEDLVQDVFLQAMRRGVPPNLRNLHAWLTTSLHNLFVDHYRSATRRPSHESIKVQYANFTQIEPDGPEPRWTGITGNDIRDALGDIEPVYRDVYVLHTFDRLSYGQIAERLGIQRITVGTRLNRARKKLREVLVERFGLEDQP